MRHNNEKGFTLIETLVAIGILAIFLGSVTSSYLSNLKRNMDTQLKYEAIQAAQVVLDQLRMQDISALATSGHQSSQVTIGSRPYDVKATFCQNSSYCPSLQIRHIAVDVTRNSKLLYETETIFSEL